jgi:NADPH:quinone reductase-like Zn-dependent oxidoreductase
MATTSYQAILLTGKGGPEVLKRVEQPLRPPAAGEVRVRTRACGLGFTDVIMRRGYYPFAPPMPFVPGYEVLGVVDAVGEGVTGLRPGQRVAALTVHGGYAEYVYREAEHWVPVPDGLDDAEAVSLVLNYVTAHQMLHRTARVEKGQRVLVTGAAGGVGTALLQLARVAGVACIGAASAPKHGVVRSLGAEPIDYRAAPIDEATLALAPGGVDAAFDGIGGANIGRCVRAVRPGGIVVAYGFTGAASGGLAANLSTASGMLSLFVGSRMRGRRGEFYGITVLYRKDKTPFLEDLPRLFDLLARREIAPLITERIGLDGVHAAHERLEAGKVEGKIVLIFP